MTNEPAFVVSSKGNAKFFHKNMLADSSLKVKLA